MNMQTNKADGINKIATLGYGVCTEAHESVTIWPPFCILYFIAS